MLVFFFLFLFGFVFAFVVKYAFISEKNGITKCVKVVIWEAQLLCMFESLFCQNNWVISHMLIVWELQFIQQRCEITQLRFLWKWIFHWKWMSIQLSMNIIQQTNKQIDNNLLYWSVLSKETMSKCSKHYNETTCLQLVVPSDTCILNISSSFNSPHKLRRVQTQENSCWFVKWPINYGIHQVPL